MDELTSRRPEGDPGPDRDARDMAGSSPGRGDARDPGQPAATNEPDAARGELRPSGGDEIEAEQPDAGERSLAIAH